MKMNQNLISRYLSAALVLVMGGSEACTYQRPETLLRVSTREELRQIFPDVGPDHPQFQAIQFLGRRRIMTALSDGRFHPDDGMLRGDALRLFLTTADISDIPTPSADPFPDVPAAHPLAGYILRAVQLGVVRGYDAGAIRGLFRVDAIVSMIEAVKMMLLSFRITPDQMRNLPSYNDIPAGVWFVPFARYVMDHHLIDAQPNGNMGRDEHLTRARVADLLYRFLQDRPDLLEAFVHHQFVGGSVQ